MRASSPPSRPPPSTCPGGRGGRLLRRHLYREPHHGGFLFLKVSKEDFDAKVKDIYIRAIRDTFGDVPYVVANDGDVSALAGAMSLEEDNILGIAMGTARAVGYVDANGNITGWLNELAFAPVDVVPQRHGGRVVRRHRLRRQILLPGLRHQAGSRRRHPACPRPLPAEKLKEVQKLMDQGGSPAEAHLPLHRRVTGATPWPCTTTSTASSTVLLLGVAPVMSGRGGDRSILATCKKEGWPTIPGGGRPS